MDNFFIIILSTLGAIFILLASVGLIRMPDLYLRISVTTKAATLGIGLILISAAIYFNELGITSRVLAIITFILLTAPVGAHMIGRASYFSGVKLWSKSKVDDLKDKYNPKTQELLSGTAKTEEKDEHKEYN
jgi:multicomponent Na+:H+ antiporter subunit G